LLKLFGAKIGKGVLIKPKVNIKYPWKLSIGDYTWIGENVWIDNLAEVNIGKNCCLSQASFLLCGNHNYKKASFDLMVSPITLEDGVWLGAGSMVTGGVSCGTQAILSVKSVASENLENYGIYRGNPALKISERQIAD
jgi:putative colanic acid biosynthesis acetyltransferase WcaF